MKSLLLASFFILATTCFAQIQVSGRVIDDEGSPLPGVNISVKGANVGTITDANGSYQLEVQPTALLVFSFIGYTNQEVPVNGRSTINITMATDITSLQEVVVVGYGIQKKELVTGAITTVSPSEITQTPVLRIEQALQGRVAGVTVTNQSGQPGDAPTVRIRGIGTNGNASPLYIVDGFPVSGIDFLNPGDIENISVLKDAASSAIYGARGANGVVIITTKKGALNQWNVTYDGYMGVQNPWKKVSVLDAREYMIMMNEGAVNAGLSPKYADPNNVTVNTDWQDELFSKNAPIANHQVSLTGGNNKSMFSSSVNYFTQEGIVGGNKSKFERSSFRINATHNISDKFKFSNNLVYTQIKRQAISSNLEFGGVLNNAINLDPLTPAVITDPEVVYPANAVRNKDGNYFGISSITLQEVVNPLARLAITHGQTKVDKVVGNVSADYEIVKGLTYRLSAGVDLGYVSSNNYSPIYYLNAAQNTTQSNTSKSTARYYQWQVENLLSYSTSLNDRHFIEAMVGTTALKADFENLFGFKAGLITTDPSNAFLNNATDAASAQTAGGFSESSLASFFARANYSFNEKYLFSATIRRDGSSKFGINNRYATFPSFSAGWVMTEENFLDGSFLEFAKLRASWGQNGSESSLGAYPWAATISTGFGYTFNGQFVNGSIPAFIPNPNIKWETSEQTDIGVDLAFLQNKLQVTIDYYIKTTKDQILPTLLSGTVGSVGNTQFTNAGDVQNKGWEFTTSYTNKLGGINYNAGFNIAFNKNKVTSTGGSPGQEGASFSTYGTISRYEVGFPIGYFIGYKTDGIFQNAGEIASYTNTEGNLLQPNAVPGDVRFVDVNGDGVINAQDRTMVGNPTPKVSMGFTLSAEFKGFDVNVFVQGAYGQDIFNGLKRHDLVESNMPAFYLDRWTGEGSSNTLPRFSWNDPNGNYSRISDLYIENGSFTRIKNVQIGYNIPVAKGKFMPLAKARVYASADNLLTFTQYRGYDPEIGARSALDIGVDRGVYPQPRTYRVGFSVTF
jgi:TonB-dependent starch-binding outer membrane protein SusC